jgi:hypothetical protein
MPRNITTKRPQRTLTVPVSTPAPYKGLNTVDSLADMDPDYGLSIQNFIATPQGLSVREGYRVWATGLPGDVTTLMPYNAKNSTNSKLFAASVSGLYDVTTGGAVGAAVVSGLNASNPYWQYAMMTASTASNSYLLCVNGADHPQLYDGTSWTATSQVATPSSIGQFSTLDNNSNTVNTQTFVDVIQHQQRLWFVASNSTTAYYTNIAQATGNLFAFDFGSFFPRGGKLAHLASWSMNMGSVNGVQSNLIAFSDKGDCVIFVGNNPAVATSWALTGTYPLAAPIGRRCTIPFTSDLLYLSRDGLEPLSTYIQTDALNSTTAITNKISPTISDLISSFGSSPGFELAAYPAADLLILNIPQASTGSNFQFVYNTITMGWTQFTGWASSTWGLFNNAMYFGAPGQVCLSFIGYSDGADISGSGGNNIIATALTAFDFMADKQGLGRGVLKHVHQVKPYIVTGTVNPTIRVGVNTDFTLVPIVGSATVNPVTGAVWDNAKWDDPSATWVGSLTTYNQWTTPRCYAGDALAFAMSISATSQTLWAGTGWLVEPGGQIG